MALFHFGIKSNRKNDGAKISPAMHVKYIRCKGALSHWQRYPHVHIMFSERLIDDVEKIKERSPKNVFKYPSRKKKDGSEPTFYEKLIAVLLNLTNGATMFILLNFALILLKSETMILAKNGFSIHVDHRSLKAQKEI